MKNLRIRNTILLLTATTLTLVSPFTKKDRVYDLNYSINSSYHYQDTTVAFRTSTCGDIYIIKEEIEDTYKPPTKTAIVIIDETKDEDLNMRIKKSCNINNPDQMMEVLEVIKKYNELYPSKWKRLLDSMMNEWEVHNALSKINYMPKHTDHVDLNNDDENTYNHKVLTKIFGK